MDTNELPAELKAVAALAQAVLESYEKGLEEGGHGVGAEAERYWVLVGQLNRHIGAYHRLIDLQRSEP